MKNNNVVLIHKQRTPCSRKRTSRKLRNIQEAAMKGILLNSMTQYTYFNIFLLQLTWLFLKLLNSQTSEVLSSSSFPYPSWPATPTQTSSAYPFNVSTFLNSVTGPFQPTLSP